MASFYRREVIQQSLEIIWRKKYLWFLGFFAGLVAHGGEPDLLFRNFNSVTWLKDNLAGLRDVIRSGDGQRFLTSVNDFVHDFPLNTLAYIALALLLFVLLVWLIMVAQTAVVYIVGRTSQKKSAGLFDGLAVGTEKFWPMIILNLITKLFAWGLWIILAALPAINYLITGQPIWGLIAVTGSILVTLPLSMVISFITKFAIGYITLDNAEPIDALRKAWSLFRRNWLISIELAIVIFLINSAAALVVAGVATVTVQTVSNWTEFYTLVAALALVHAFVSTFSYAAWTTAFLKLVEGKGTSTISQWTSRLVGMTQPKKSMT